MDCKILSLQFLIEYWWCNTLTRENNWFLKVLVKSNFATPTPYGSVSCLVAGVCLSNYNLNSFHIHQASFSKGCQWYLMCREVLGSIWKIGRYPIKVSEVLAKPYQLNCRILADPSPISRRPISWIIWIINLSTWSMSKRRLIADRLQCQLLSFWQTFEKFLQHGT